MSIEILPIYNKLFSSDSAPTSSDWEAFKTNPDSPDVKIPSYVDLCVTTKVRTWQELAYDVMVIIVKIVIFPLIIYDGIKYLVGRIVMKFVLPAQLRPKLDVDAYRRKMIGKNQDIIIRHVTLQKDGINYRGLLCGHEANLSNGNWALHAVGNNVPIEYVVPDSIQPYFESKLGSGYNVLLVNEPNVGRSEGLSDPENMANSQEVGISFLESAVKAKKIVLTGHSIGGASIGKAILQHEFKPNIDYRVIQLMTFDKLSHMAELAVGRLGRKVFHWLGYEMDNVASSRKLEEHNIPEIVIQGEDDEVMKRASLKDALQTNGITKNKTFHVIPNAEHNDFPHDELKQILFKPEVEQKSLYQKISSKLGVLYSRLPGFRDKKERS